VSVRDDERRRDGGRFRELTMRCWRGWEGVGGGRRFGGGRGEHRWVGVLDEGESKVCDRQSDLIFFRSKLGRERVGKMRRTEKKLVGISPIASVVTSRARDHPSVGLGGAPIGEEAGEAEGRE
jgi:hypothetical protein